jgi:hypothetical protein
VNCGGKADGLFHPRFLRTKGLALAARLMLGRLQPGHKHKGSRRVALRAGYGLIAQK